MSRADVDEFLTRVDAATRPVCGSCAAELDPDGPSLYFCDDACSACWHTTQSEPLVGYVEPWHRPWDFPGIGRDWATSAPAASAEAESVDATRAWLELVASRPIPRMSAEPVRYARIRRSWVIEPGQRSGASADLVFIDDEVQGSST